MFLGNYQVFFISALCIQRLRSLVVPGLVFQQDPLLLPSRATLPGERETLSEAAVHARELIQYSSVISSISQSDWQSVPTLVNSPLSIDSFSFPATSQTGSLDPEDYPDESLKGLPIGLQEYFSPFPNGDLLLLALPVSIIYRNINHTYPHTATIAIKDELGSIQRKGSLWAANRRRVSLFGTIHLVPKPEVQQAKELYERFHPDSNLWDDENGPHRSFWITKLYYFGGFGDRAAIGWLDLQRFRNGFKDSMGSKNRSTCFHPEGPNLYCDQINEEITREGTPGQEYNG